MATITIGDLVDIAQHGKLSTNDFLLAFLKLMKALQFLPPNLLNVEGNNQSPNLLLRTACEYFSKLVLRVKTSRIDISAILQARAKCNLQEVGYTVENDSRSCLLCQGLIAFYQVLKDGPANTDTDDTHFKDMTKAHSHIWAAVHFSCRNLLVLEQMNIFVSYTDPLVQSNSGLESGGTLGYPWPVKQTRRPRDIRPSQPPYCSVIGRMVEGSYR
jgi:hypothetical protein